MSAQSMTLSERLQRYEKHIKAPKPAVAGILTRVVGLTLEAKGLRAPVGSQCKIETIN
ncbi:MAG: flagellum-specific ATP synthase FliI, partial [Pseudomonadota bacterium]